jgi:hypothetical protein
MAAREEVSQVFLQPEEERMQIGARKQVVETVQLFFPEAVHVPFEAAWRLASTPSFYHRGPSRNTNEENAR